MKKVLLFGFFSLLLFSCAEDIVVDPPTSLRGFYIGKYYVQDNVSGATETKEDVVWWTFTDQSHYCDFPSVSERLFCDFSGSYSVETNLSLSITEIAQQICILDDIPEGTFSIQWIRVEDGNDTLQIEQFDVPNDRKKIAIMEKQPEIEQ